MLLLLLELGEVGSGGLLDGGVHTPALLRRRRRGGLLLLHDALKGDVEHVRVLVGNVAVGHQTQKVVDAGVALGQPVLHPQRREARRRVRPEHAGQIHRRRPRHGPEQIVGAGPGPGEAVGALQTLEELVEVGVGRAQISTGTGTGTGVLLPNVAARQRSEEVFHRHFASGAVGMVAHGPATGGGGGHGGHEVGRGVVPAAAAVPAVPILQPGLGQVLLAAAAAGLDEVGQIVDGLQALKVQRHEGVEAALPFHEVGQGLVAGQLAELVARQSRLEHEVVDRGAGTAAACGQLGGCITVTVMILAREEVERNRIM